MWWSLVWFLVLGVQASFRKPAVPAATSSESDHRRSEHLHPVSTVNAATCEPYCAAFAGMKYEGGAPKRVASSYKGTTLCEIPSDMDASNIRVRKTKA